MWPRDERKIIEYTQRRTTRHEVFVNPVIYKDTGVMDKTVLNRDNVLGSWVLWADFDGNSLAVWPENSDIPEPSIRIITSTESHQHCYWELSEFLTDPNAIEAKNRSIAYSLDADKSGWDYSQLLRPPDTTNHGYGKDRRGRTYDVRFEETSDRIYAPSQLVENDSYRPIKSFWPKDEIIPPVTQVLASHTFSDKFLALFNSEIIPENRSGALFALACEAAEAGLTDVEIYSVTNYTDSIWGKYAGRRDHDRRLVSDIETVRERIPFGLPAVQFNSLFGDIEVAPKSGFSFKEFMALDIHFEWLFEGLLPKCGYLIIYGAPGVGKTLLGMDFTNAAIQGIPWLAWKNTSGPIKILFLSLEMNQVMLQEQYKKMTVNYDQGVVNQMDARLRIYPLAETLPLDKPEGRRYLTQILSESDFHPDLILIDSLSELSEKSLQDDEPARNLNRFLRHLRNRYNVGICIIHHNKKSGSHATHSDLDDMWGSRFLGAGADTILYIENSHRSANDILVTQDKSRMSAIVEPFFVERDWNEFSFTYDGQVEDQTADEFEAKGVANVARNLLGREPGAIARGKGTEGRHSSS
jgi:hypothetical protein